MSYCQFKNLLWKALRGEPVDNETGTHLPIRRIDKYQMATIYIWSIASFGEFAP